MPLLKHDLAGQRFGKLQVLKRAPDFGRVRWFCLCDCGRHHAVLSHNLLSGAVSHCGCSPKNPSHFRLTGQRLSKYVGKKIGRLTAISYHVSSQNRQLLLCRCECGTEKLVSYSNFSTGKSRSCGCLLKETRGKGRRRHGMSGSPEYIIWQRMLARCRKLSDPLYRNYGARGISVDERWHSFDNFIQDLGRRPGPKFTLERNAKDVPYGPTSTRWCEKSKAIYNRANSRIVEINGRKLSASEAAREANLCKQTVNLRLHKGVPAERAIFPGRIWPQGKFEYRGSRFTMKRLSAEVGLKHSTLYTRIRSGMSVEEAIQHIRKKKRTIFGVERSYIEEISKKYEIPELKIRSRLRAGWTMEEIIAGRSVKKTLPFRNGAASISEFCIITGASRELVWRERKKGKSLDEIDAMLAQRRVVKKAPKPVKRIGKLPVDQRPEWIKRVDTLLAEKCPEGHCAALQLMIDNQVTNPFHAAWHLNLSPNLISSVLEGKRDPKDLRITKLRAFKERVLPFAKSPVRPRSPLFRANESSLSAQESSSAI